MAKMDINSASINSEMDEKGTLNLSIKGHLDSNTTGKIWREAMLAIKNTSPEGILVEAGGLNYCDGTGIALLFDLKLMQERKLGKFEIRNLADEFEQLLDQFKSSEFIEAGIEKSKSTNLFEDIGSATFGILQEIYSIISFLGQLIIALFSTIVNPQLVRWKDVFVTAELIGVNAFTIIALVCFLIGLVMAFQAAIPMSQYGAQLFVADLIVISIFKELGPLMTAFVVNGRSGSAFAAEIGTMKVKEEVDALTTMGLDPIRFLVVPRVIAALIMIPILTIFGNLFGLIGGLVVILSLGFTVVTYINQITDAGTYVMLLSGLIKSVFFAFIIAAVGCHEGLQTKTGASAVGESTTSAVVIGIVLLIFVDGIFGVVYYYLGI